MTFVDWDDMPRWKLICDELDLPFHEPVETYSTSPHVLLELDIPEGVTGVLPRAARTRAGLDAEQVEDLGGREPRRPCRPRRRRAERRPGPGQSRARARRERTERSERTERPARNRQRRRTRAGEPVADDATASGTDARRAVDRRDHRHRAPCRLRGERRRRRAAARRRGGRGRGRAGGEAGADTGIRRSPARTSRAATPPPRPEPAARAQRPRHGQSSPESPSDAALARYRGVDAPASARSTPRCSA